MPTGVSILGVPGLTQADTNAASYRYNGEMSPEIALEEQALNRRQQIANLLLQRGLSTPPQGQMVGRFYVPPSPLQGAAQLGQAALGAFGTYANDQGRKDLADKDRQMVVEAMEAYKRSTSDVPAVQGQAPPAPTPQAQVAQALVQQQQPFMQDPTAQPGIGQFPPTTVDPETANLQAKVGGYDVMPSPAAQPPGAGYQMQPDPEAPTLQAQQEMPQQMAAASPPPTQGPISPGTPARARTTEERRQAMLELMANQHPQVRNIGALLQQQDIAQQEKATNREFQQGEKALDRDVRLEGIKENAAMRAEQIRGNMTLTQMQIDAREQAGRDANELKKDLARQNADLQKTLHGMDIEGRKEMSQQGKTPPGYRQTAEGNLEAIPGGPADTKQQGALNQDTLILQNSNAGLDRLATTANQLLNHPGLSGITGVRGKVPDIPGSDAANARALLNTLKSQIGFGVMQEMRNNAKSGSSGLGALSDAEGKRLENNLAALDTTQGLEQFKAQLQNGVVDYANGAKDRLREGYNMKHKTGEPVPMAPAGKGPAVGTVEGGYRFKGGDPAKSESWEKQ